MNEKMVDHYDKAIAANHLDWQELGNTTFFISGATGLIGSQIVRLLLYLNDTYSLHLKIVCLARSWDRLRVVYETELLAHPAIEVVIGDVCQSIGYEGHVDYLIHGAAMTASAAFVTSPVEVIRTNVEGAFQMLEFCRKKEVRSAAYLSTMEVYGNITTEIPVTEETLGPLDILSPRSSYPQSKRLCETLCAAYSHEYNVPVKIVRLTQTFGPGVSFDDTRVFAQFARAAYRREDIVLHTEGKTKRNYLFVIDAVMAILTVLLRGSDGTSYNAANEEIFLSISQMAHFVAQKIAHNQISVRYEIKEDTSAGYAPSICLPLDTFRLKALGWRPTGDLATMYETMLDSWRDGARDG